MDELKLLIGMVADLPALAVWVLCGYLLYKIVVIGSIYGLIRFAIDKAHDWLTKRKQVSMEVLLDGIEFDSHATKDELMKELRRLMFIGNPEEYKSGSIHAEYGVKLLRETINKMYDDNPTVKRA